MIGTLIPRLRLSIYELGYDLDCALEDVCDRDIQLLPKNKLSNYPGKIKVHSTPLFFLVGIQNFFFFQDNPIIDYHKHKFVEM